MRIKTHPGKILKEEFMLPLKLSARTLAKQIDVPHNRISQIIKEDRSITADTAHRLAAYFGTTPQLWMNLQRNYDLSKELAEREREYKAIPSHA